MDGAGASAENFGNRTAYFYPGGILMRIHFFRTGGKKKVCTGSFCDFHVMGEGSGVLGIVFIGTKLGGVYENGGNGDIIFCMGRFD